MYKICKTEQSAARQRELEQFLLKEMLVKHFDDITISDLCDGIGIPRKAFYRYFSGKRGALHALIDHTLIDFDQMTLVAGQSRDVTQRQYLELYFRFWWDQKKLLDAIERSDLWQELMCRTVDYAQTELDRSHRFLPKDQQDEGAYLTRFTVYGMVGVVQSWYRQNFLQSAEYMAGMTVKYLSQALEFWK